MRGEGRLEFVEDLRVKAMKADQEEIVACQKVGEPAYTSVTVWQPGGTWRKTISLRPKQL